ncbi:MAG TPA: RNA 2',3'-cyclic phosphodiesterase [Terriglobales bacterium]
MRVFVGLDIDPAIRERMTRYLEGVRGFAPEARWVKPESFHVTLKFIGEQKDELVEEIKRELATVRGQPFEVSFRGNGFFPNARSPRVFWLGIEAGEQLRQLAKAVDEAVARTGVERETNAYQPHLTLARSGSGRSQPMPGDTPSPPLRHLGEKLEGKSAPDFGTMTAREFFLYESKLSPSGAKYSKIARIPLE